MCVHFIYTVYKVVTVAFIWCFSCFNWCSYCRGKCVCAGQGHTIVSHFVVQRADFIVAIACIPCGPRRSLIYACAWGFWVCWETVCCCRIKACLPSLPAVVSILTDSAARVTVLLHSTAPLHIYYFFLMLWGGGELMMWWRSIHFGLQLFDRAKVGTFCHNKVHHLAW